MPITLCVSPQLVFLKKISLLCKSLHACQRKKISAREGIGGVEYPLRHSMKLVELGARSMNFVDLEFLELGCLARKKWSGAIFVDLELRGALPNTP
jgi:hypothetical protein